MSDVNNAVAEGEVLAPAYSPASEAWRMFLRNRSAILGLLLMAIVLIVTLVCPFFYPVDPFDVVWGPFAPPGDGPEVPLGSDFVGRDAPNTEPGGTHRFSYDARVTEDGGSVSNSASVQCSQAWEFEEGEWIPAAECGLSSFDSLSFTVENAEPDPIDLTLNFIVIPETVVPTFTVRDYDDETVIYTGSHGNGDEVARQVTGDVTVDVSDVFELLSFEVDCGAFSGEMLGPSIAALFFDEDGSVECDVTVRALAEPDPTGTITIDKAANRASTPDESTFVFDGGDLGSVITGFPGSAVFNDVPVGSHTITERPFNGDAEDWFLTSVTCTIDGSPTDYEFDGESTSVTVEVAADDDILCTFFNATESDPEPGTVRIEKRPAEGSVADDSVFEFEMGDIAADQTLEFNDPSDTFTVEPGVYTVTERETEGWRLVDIDCFIGESEQPFDTNEANGTVDIDVDEGDDVFCIFFNEEVEPEPTFGELIVIKEFPDDESSFDFTIVEDFGLVAAAFREDFSGEFSLSPGDQWVLSDHFDGRPNIPLVVTEVLTPAQEAAGIFLDRIECDGGFTEVDGSSVVVYLTDNDVVTCRFFNEAIDPPGELIVRKDYDVDPNESFDFSVVAEGFSDSFVLADGDDWLLSDLDGSPSTGTFTISESLDFAQRSNGVYLSAIDCAGGDPDIVGGEVTVTVDPGETVTCTYTNAQTTVEIFKDAGEDTDESFRFELVEITDLEGEIDEELVAEFELVHGEGSGPIGVRGGRDFEIREIDSGSFSFVGGQCTNIDDAAWFETSDGVGFQPADGDAVECTIFNEAEVVETTITVTKEADAAADGDTFTFIGPGGQSFELGDGESRTFAVEPGAVTITEVDTPGSGWAPSRISCSNETVGDLDSGSVTVNLREGSDVRCTFVNELTTLVVSKDAEPNTDASFVVDVAGFDPDD